MKHLNILYMIMSISIGFSSISIILFVVFKTKDRFLKVFLFFFSSFSLIIITNSIHLYIKTNLSGDALLLIIIGDYIDSFCIGLMMFAIAYLAHNFIEGSSTKIRNIIFAIISFALFVINEFSLRIYFSPVRSLNLTNIPFLDMSLQKLAFILTNIYSVIIGIYYFGRITDRERKKLIRHIMIIVTIFIPGIIVDLISPAITMIKFSPILYVLFGIIVIYYILRYYLNQTMIPKSNMPNDEFFRKYGISPREKEVLLLVAEGCSNKKIGDRLFISLSTVKAHISSIFQKLGVESRFELITFIKKANLNEFHPGIHTKV